MRVRGWYRCWRVSVPVLCAALLVIESGLPAGATELVLWTKRYNGPGNSTDTPVAAALSPDGSHVFVTGSSWGAGSGYDYATLSYSTATGAVSWTKRYNGPANGTDQARALGVSPDGTKVFVTGGSAGGSSGVDYFTQAYNAMTGQTLWSVRHNDSVNGEDLPAALGVSPDGSQVFVTGAVRLSDSNYDYATQAYNANTGAVEWTRRFVGGGRDKATALGVSADGSEVFVTGWSQGENGYDYQTIAYSAATGAVLWKNRYVGPVGDDIATALGVSGDGSKVFVTGVSASMSSGQDYATVAYNATTGAILWTKRYNGPGNGDDLPAALGVSTDGSKVFVTGRSTGSPGDLDFATVAYNATTGAALWTKRYNGPGFGNDGAYALAVSGDMSQVIVTGFTGSEYATLAYNAATGAWLWTKLYSGAANSIGFATAVAVNGDASKVFVTGSNSGSTSGYDYTTLAYSAA